MKYPIELELTNYCLLKCEFCPNKDFKNRSFIDEKYFYKIIDYIYFNRNKILFLDLSWIWDVFLHPKIWDFLLYISKKFKNTNFEILIPTKWNSINYKHINVLKQIHNEWLNFNLSIGFYSMLPEKHDIISWKENFFQIIDFIKKIKNEQIPFSLELLIDKYSINELKYFYKFWDKLWVNYKVHNYHNFWWSIKNKELEKFNSKDFKLKCSFADDEKYKLDNFYCEYTLPFIWSDGFLYLCSHWWKQLKYKSENILDLFIKYPNYLDLLEYIKNRLTKNICRNCTYLKYNK